MVAFPGTSVLLMVVMASSLAALATAQNPGKTFPFYDNCRKQQANQLRNLTYTGRTALADGSAQFCFKINLMSGKCVQETFMQKKVTIKSRCCNTTFAKIKFWTSSACKLQFQPSKITVPLLPKLSRTVSPVWEHLDNKTANKFTDVKYTQFGPIPQAYVDGTTFCLRVLPPTGGEGSKCSIASLAGITNPLTPNNFQVAIYDRKSDNYECCPSWKIATGGRMRRRWLH